MRNIVAERFAGGEDNAMNAAAASAADFEDMINLSIGDTDFTTDERIIRAAMADALAGHTHYTASKGDPELIEEVCRYYQQEYGLCVKKEEVFVTTSSCFGMELALMAVLNPGDEVIVFSPYFTPYKEQIELAGGVTVEVECREEDGFAISRQALEAAVSPRTRAMILNNPCNPTGAAYGPDCLAMIAEVAQKNDLLVLADEIYTDYMYQIPFVPLRSLPGMAERTITLNSFSKNYIMTGWRIGYIIAQPALVEVLDRINGNMVYSAPSISQRAAIHALRLRGEIGGQYTSSYAQRVAYAADRINAMEKLSVLKPQGTFYLFPNITATGLSSAQFCAKLRTEAHVVMVPGSAFGKAGEGYVRIACTVSQEKLKEAFDRIEKLQF
ncbi:MAG: aminotransferase class I/II-fold pyridoxal phosphate-dependent enzyme [Pygmaiobacter massiliensis]|nr:aminotransferase class I/II-fold pyridoxal phosphate-dependent enzyme [Pygmaiobacter massiliensis]